MRSGIFRDVEPKLKEVLKGLPLSGGTWSSSLG
jgi:hypothetical protein